MAFLYCAHSHSLCPLLLLFSLFVVVYLKDYVDYLFLGTHTCNDFICGGVEDSCGSPFSSTMWVSGTALIDSMTSAFTH